MPRRPTRLLRWRLAAPLFVLPVLLLALPVTALAQEPIVVKSGDRIRVQMRQPSMRRYRGVLHEVDSVQAVLRDPTGGLTSIPRTSIVRVELSAPATNLHIGALKLTLGGALVGAGLVGASLISRVPIRPAPPHLRTISPYDPAPYVIAGAVAGGLTGLILSAFQSTVVWKIARLP